MVDGKNLIIFMSDEHSAKWLGSYGQRFVKTPNLDQLAARGTRFTSAYCASPICVPARAAFATGKYIHQIGFWDNADPYDGSVPSWHHRLRSSGHEVVSIGKLHFRSADDDNGFSREIIPLHIYRGIGEPEGLLRENPPPRKGARNMAEMAGPGETAYTHYDREITRRAQRWLHEQSSHKREKPWVLFVSYMSPHFPLTAPEEFYAQYRLEDVPWPKFYEPNQRPTHPFIRDYVEAFNFDDFFDEAKVRRAIAGYCALITFLDDNIGRVLRTLKDCGLEDDVRVIYTSDHGDNLGARGLWGKSVMYEESVNVPLILAGPGIPAGQSSATPVSHVDAHPTILELTGCQDAAERALPGSSLLKFIYERDTKRTILAEYHAMGSKTAAFMLRDGRFKYVHYADYPPQLFDLVSDPEEERDLAEDFDQKSLTEELERKLRTICDPKEVDRRAKARQAALIEALGGRLAILERQSVGFSPSLETVTKMLQL